MSVKVVEQLCPLCEIESSVVLDLMPDCMICLDGEGVILSVNKETEINFGYSKAKLIGQKIELLIPERFHKPHVVHRSAYVRKATKRPIGDGLELFAKRKDGSEFPCEVSLSPLNSEGSVAVLCILRNTSEKIQLEEIAENAKSLMPKVLDNLPQHIALLDNKFNVIAVNKAWRDFAADNEFTGLNNGVGSNYFTVCELAKHDSVVEAEQVIKALLDVSEGRKKEERIDYSCHSPFEKRWFQVRINRIEKIKEFQIIIAHENVSEIRLIQESLRDNLSRYRTLVDTSPFCIHEIDLQGRLLSMNRAGLKMIGKNTTREVLGLDYMSFVSEDDRNRVSRLFTQSCLGRKANFEFIATDGKVFQSSFNPLKTKDKVVIRVIGITQDITESYLKQQELEESEKRFRHAAENATDLIFLIDIAVRTIEWHGDVLSILGYSPNTLEELAANAHPDDRQALIDKMEEFIAKGIEYKSEYRICCHDETYRYWQTGAAWLDESKTKAIGFVKDVTEQRKSEEKLRLSYIQAERHRENLSHFNRLETLGSMSVGIAHEINQPLAAIASYSMAVQKYISSGNFDSKKILDLMKKISDQSRRAGMILVKLREMMKKKEIKPTPLNLNKVLLDILSIAETKTKISNCELKFQLANDLPVTLGDAIQLQQVVLNLVHNSVDAMVDEDCCVSKLVTLQTLQKDENTVEVRVIDCGTGIAKENLDSLFEPFKTHKKNGLGMGLVICKNIINAHGGKIWYAPLKDGRPCFRFTVPIRLD